MLAVQLRHIDDLDGLIEEVSAEIKQRMHPFEEDLRRIETIPGIGGKTAELILAEIGTDMGRSRAHNTSHLGPGCVRGIMKVRANDEVAGPAKEILGCGRSW